MAIKESTTQKIEARMAGSDDWAVVGGYYNPWWTIPCICGHAIKTVFLIGHAGDHGPAFSNDTFHIGSECIKFVAKSPRFSELSKDLEAKRVEVAAIQRRMKREREIAFHATPEWKAISKEMNHIADVFYFVQSNRLSMLCPEGLDRWVSFYVREYLPIIQKLNHDVLHFQDLETAQERLNQMRATVKEIVEAMRPHVAEMKAFVARNPSGSLGVSGVKEIISRL